MAPITSMKSLAVPLLIVAVVLVAFWGVAGGAWWFRGWHGWQSMGMHGMMMRSGAPAPADAPAALTQHACTSCHALHEGGVGPAFSWIAWRYRGQPGAQETVATFIAHGGQGPWGGVMPNLAVSPLQAQALAQWILALPPEAPPNPGRFK
jgi:cytochrome c